MQSQNNNDGNNITRIFNFVGGALIFFGVTFFIVSNWIYLTDFTKILATLGSAIAAYLIALLLANDERFSASSSAFFMVSGFVLPLGLYVTANIYGFSAYPAIVNVVITGICFCTFLITEGFLQREILILFCIVFGSLFFIALTNFLVHESSYLFSNTMCYQFMTLGLSYIFLGRYLNYEGHVTAGALYFCGSIFILSTSFDLAGFLFINQGTLVWKWVASLMLLSCFLLAVPLKSRSLLYVGALFLLIYIVNMTTLFADFFGKIGWALMLIGSGFLLMIIGYLVVTLHRQINKKRGA